MGLEFSSSLDDSRFTAGLRKMEAGADKTAARMEKTFSSVGPAFVGIAASAAGAGFAVKGLLDHFGDLADSASAVNLSAEAFQKYSGLLSEGGTNAQKFEMGMVSLTQAIQGAKSGSVEMLDKFDALGVSWQNLQDMDTEGVLNAIASGLANASDQSAAFDAALDILGKRNAKFVAQLRDHGDAFKEHAAGIKSMTDEEIAALDKAGDAWDRLGNNIKTVSGGFLAGIFKFHDFAEGLSGQKPKQSGKSSKATDPFANLPSMLAPKDPRTIAAEKELDKNLAEANKENEKAQSERERVSKNEIEKQDKLARAWDDLAEKIKERKELMEKEIKNEKLRIINSLKERRESFMQDRSAQMEREVGFNLSSTDDRRSQFRQSQRLSRAESRANRALEAAKDPSRRFRDARSFHGDLGGNLQKVVLDDQSITKLTNQIEKLIAAP